MREGDIYMSSQGFASLRYADCRSALDLAVSSFENLCAGSLVSTAEFFRATIIRGQGSLGAEIQRSCGYTLCSAIGRNRWSEQEKEERRNI